MADVKKRKPKSCGDEKNYDTEKTSKEEVEDKKRDKK